MREYNATLPSISGILSDDHLYFEGVSRPKEIFILRDGEDISYNNVDILEKYCNDIYNLFLRKLSTFMAVEYVTAEEETKLQALLQELLKVKLLLRKSSKNTE